MDTVTRDWESFARWAARVDRSGFRLIVPVVGAGFNAQAGAILGWSELLRVTRDAAGIEVELPVAEELIGNTTLAWEAMVLAMVVKLSDAGEPTQPHQAERKLLRLAAKELERHYPPSGPTKDFAERFLSHRFRDIISFNFDRVLQVEPVTWRDDPKYPRTGSFAQLGRGTRIWYPHGFVGRPDSIQLGMRNYGTYMEELERARKRYKTHEERVKKTLESGAAGRQRSDTRRREELWLRTRETAPSWLALAMNAPLVFIGFGAGREEWPLWWFLNQRARNHARRRIERPVFVLMTEEQARGLRTAATLTGVRLLECETHADGWERLFRAFHAPATGSFTEE